MLWWYRIESNEAQEICAKHMVVRCDEVRSRVLHVIDARAQRNLHISYDYVIPTHIKNDRKLNSTT